MAAATTKATGATAKRAAPAKEAAPTRAAKQPAAEPAASKPSATKAAPPKQTPKRAAPKAPTAKTAVPKRTSAKQAPSRGAAATQAPTAPAKRPGRKRTVVCPLSGFEVTPGASRLSLRTRQRLEKQLLEERARLLHQVEELVAEAEELAREREGGDTQFDEESGEGDTIAVERERDLLLSAQARHVVEEIDAALARMRAGTYGVCSYAGRPIPLERLEAIPWADVCVDCKARAERRR